MSTQIISDLLVDLSTEQQQLLAGGQDEQEGLDGDQSENNESDSKNSSSGCQGFLSFPSPRNQYLFRGTASLRKI
ncbi:Bacteriocin [Nostoc sp. DSM 114161]|jgi:hypothetical protein|uniref:hypothetical protein n=1 Tax=Nostoc sp. DSM 114161 TaxID=3440143 RepID=UPI0040467598